MHPIQEAFGEDCNLYKDVLKCPEDADKAQLRKSYYRAALKYHPDKNPGKDAAAKFQAISLAYQILLDPDSRAAYDESGHLPDSVDDDDDNTEGMEQWKAYFDQIFGKVTTSDIDAFASKYKCSDEERRDVIAEFEKRRGNLVKMLDFVMLSEPRDAVRWVEDFIVPAVEDGTLKKPYKEAMEKSLDQIKKKLEKENKANEEDDEATETESEEEDLSPSSRKGKRKSPAARNSAKKKNKKSPDDFAHLVAQIQNKNRGGGSSFASLAARYGVSDVTDDPLDDAEFARIQSKMKKKTRT